LDDALPVSGLFRETFDENSSLSGGRLRRTRESLLFRGSSVNFDNGKKNMLKTSQDRLVRASHDSPERLFFPFSDVRLKLTNRAGGEGADRQPIGASGGANLAREIGPQRCHGGLGDLFVRTRMDYFSDQTHDIPRLAGPNSGGYGQALDIPFVTA
jgi:hypothetical protein